MNGNKHTKYVDGVIGKKPRVHWATLTREWVYARTRRMPTLVALALFLVLSNSVIYLTAFEAHVVNVIATIERPPSQCEAVSIGYWKNHEGCEKKGAGASIWSEQIQSMTADNFSGLFHDVSGESICQALWGKCPSGFAESTRCKAYGMALADELNLVSGHLSLDALVAGADDGTLAFYNLGLDYNSTVGEALSKIELIIGNGSSSESKLKDAAYVAERLYAFYEDENSIAPLCVLDPILLSQDVSMQSIIHQEEENKDLYDEKSDSEEKKNIDKKDEFVLELSGTSTDDTVTETPIDIEQTSTSTDERSNSIEETASSTDEKIADETVPEGESSSSTSTEEVL